jgi:hypothetical protein
VLRRAVLKSYDDRHVSWSATSVELMDTATQLIFAVFVVFFLALYLLYEVMVLRVNRHLPSNESVSLIPLREWPRLMSEHARLYPQSGLRKFVVCCAATVLSLSVLLVVVRLWLYLRT